MLKKIFTITAIIIPASIAGIFIFSLVILFLVLIMLPFKILNILMYKLY